MNNIKSVCFVLNSYLFYETGGAELQVYNLSEEFVKRGWKVSILVRKKNKRINKKYLNPFIQYYFFKGSFSSIIEFISGFFILKKIDSQFFIVRTDFALSGAIAFFSILFNRKFIYYLADDEATIKKRYSLKLNKKNYKNVFKYFYRKLDYWIKDKLIEYAKKNADIIIAQTENQQKKLLTNFKLHSIKVSNSFLINPSINKKENIILWVANCRPIKQPELFFKIISHVDELKPKNWKIVMIGRCDDYLTYLTKLENIDFLYLGELDFENTLDWFKKSRILINTSISEGFSNTFIQAWLHGVYILSLNADPDYLLSKKGLGYCAKGDLNKLELQLNKIILGEINIEDVIKSAKKYAEKEFNVKNNVTKLEKLLLNESTLVSSN